MNLDKKTLIHAGVEIVIIGGVVFYLIKQINAQTKVIQQIQKENEELKRIIAAQNGHLGQLTHILEQKKMLTKADFERPQQRSKKRRRKKKKDIPKEEFDKALEEELSELETECKDGMCEVK